MNEFEALERFRAELTARGLASDQSRTDVQLLGLAEKLAEKVKQLESQIAEKVKEHETRIKELEQQIPKPSSTQGVVKKRISRRR
jgi:wobble nucleotide-excising tRNase